jgi:alpha-beta hydrolase superfamily lysophospholipase/protein-S-isoprenylcysteine O-methyltransferase Ste14
MSFATKTPNSRARRRRDRGGPGGGLTVSDEPKWIASWIATGLVIGQVVLLIVLGAGEIALLRYLGFVLWALAAVFGWLPVYQLKRRGGVAPGDSYVKTTRLVDTGLYAIVRHPQFVAWPIMSVALAFVSQHPIVIVMGAVAFVSACLDFGKIEVRNVDKFGDEYRRYMEQVPGWNFVAGLWRWTNRTARTRDRVPSEAPGEEDEMSRVFESEFVGSEGRVFFRRWEPDDDPVGIVMIVHGYAEHGGRYAHVAGALNRHRAVVYADDHIGHGRSDGERALITDFDHVVDDLHHLAGLARERYPGLPLVLVGHSMGGLLAARVAQRWPEEVAGVAFCGAVIGDWDWAREVLARPELPDIPFDPVALSRDPEVGAAYAADPLVYHGQYRRGLLEAEVVALDAYRRDNERLVMPVLILHGTDDPFVPYERSVQAGHDMPSDDVTVHVYEGARHEVLNETNRAEVVDELTAWIERIFAR